VTEKRGGPLTTDARARRSNIRTLAVVVLLVSTVARSDPNAQSRPWIIGALHYDEHRFAEQEPSPRLDGSAIGLSVLAGVALWRVPVRVEWSQNTIADRRQMLVEFVGSTLTVQSTHEHRTRTLGLLTGYAHSPLPRIQLAYLVGAAFSHVRRTFRTNAPRVVLVSPSNSNAPGVAVGTDAFSGITGGADLSFRLTDHARVMAGARLQRLRIMGELDATSVRSFAGVGWMF
jgi:hypothetical protein